MKLRRMAVLAAAAVVGPTVLTATPALAQENPPVEVPDSASKEGATDTDVVSAGFTEGPEIWMRDWQVPTSFEPGGSLQELTVLVNNGDRASVSGYVPALGISEETGALKSSHITAEVQGSDGRWRPAALRLDRGPGVFEIEFGKFDVASDEEMYLSVRIGFTSDAPQVPIELYTTGQGGNADGDVVSAANWYQSAIGDAAPDGEGGEGEVDAEGAKLTLDGVPASGFTAGADWTELTMHVDNTGRGAVDEYGYVVGLNMTRGLGQGAWLEASQIKIEAYGLDENGVEGWYPVEVDGSEEVHSMSVGGLPLDADEKTEVKLRMRFTEDAAPGPLKLHTVGFTYHEGTDTWFTSETMTYPTKIVAASPDGGSEPGDETGDTGGAGDDTTGATGDDTTGSTTGNDPEPATGGAQQVTDTGTTGTTGTPTTTGGQLAQTGADAATTWAIGGAALSLAMGAVFAAGTGRRRRPTQEA
ncbi:hypothetical protein [Streptomyces sp. NPDC050388]|uniref:hypothetical protein n=1 Tax=Streptomyces sp. NPDC050388 TaxID=3155781 RepID=UPI003426A6CF